MHQILEIHHIQLYVGVSLYFYMQMGSQGTTDSPHSRAQVLYQQVDFPLQANAYKMNCTLSLYMHFCGQLLWQIVYDYNVHQSW